MPNTVADLIVKILAEAGVRRMRGVTGDSLNGAGQAPAIIRARRSK